MKKNALLLFLTLYLLFAVSSSAETSTNLKILKETNSHGKVTVQYYVDDSGNVVMAEDKGYAILRNTYTTGNKLESTSYFDANDEPCDCKDGYSVRKLKYTGKNIANESFFSANGEPVNGPDGYAVKKTKWYQGRKHVETWLLDANGEPIRSETMYAHRVTLYKDIGTNHLAVSDTYYDADGNLFLYGDYARVEYEYQSTLAKPVRTTYLDANGEPMLNKKAGYAILERVYEKGKLHKEIYYGANGELIAGPNGYAYVEYQYRTKGSDSTQKMYYNADGSPYMLEEGYCGITEVLGPKNRVTETYYYGPDGQQGYCADGYSAWKCFYTTKGEITKKYYFDHNNKRMIVPDLGYSGVDNDYNGSLLIQTTYLGTDGKPIDAACGYAIVEYLFDKNRKPAGVKYLHADGKIPATNEEGYSYAVYESDEKGNLLSEIYYDETGTLFQNDKGVTETRYIWTNGLKTEEAYYHNGEAICCTEGYHRVAFDYNGAGKVIEKCFFGTDGQPVILADGYAGVEYEYGTDGKVMSTRYYGVDGNLLLTPGKEYAYTRKVLFDEDTQEEKGTTGYVTEYYGTDGYLMNISAGYAQKVSETNESGKVTREYYLDENDTPVRNSDGIGITENAYDGKTVIGVTYFDEKGDRIVSNKGYSRYATVKEGKVSVIYYYDEQDQLMIQNNGYAIMKREYDEAGNVAEEAYFDADEKPVLHIKNKYHRVKKTYLDAKHVTCEAWFDTDDQPMPVKDTYVAIEKDYDEELRVIAERYYGADGEKILCNAGYAEVHNTAFDEKNHVTRYEYYGLDGQRILLPNEYAIMEREYDEAGNVAEEAYFDADGKSVLHTKNKYHRVEKTYLDAKHVTREAWFDIDDQPMPVKDTYAAIEKDYDKELRVVAERYYGADGEKILCKAGYAEVHNTAFDEKNHVTRYEYYGLDGQLILLPNGYAIMEREYDEAGNVAEEAYFDADEKPVLHIKNKYHRVKKTYLDAKHVTREAWFDTDDQPMAPKNTYMAIEKDYDDNLRTVAERYYDGNGEPILCKDGYAEVRYTAFNESNKATKYEYFGIDGAPCLVKEKYSVMEREYDDEGNVVEERYFDQNGQQVVLEEEKE